MSATPTDFTPDRTLSMQWGQCSYSDKGAGAPVIYLHGYGGSRHDWEPLLSGCHGCRCITPDFRGHGGSSVPRDSFRLRHLADDILALADHLWLGTFDLVGHSLGGMVAQEILRRAPHRIGRLVLVEGWVSLAYAKRLHKGMFECMPAEESKRLQKIWHDTLVRWMPGIRDEFWFSVEHFNAESVLAQTNVPVLAFFGTHGRAPLSNDAMGLPTRKTVQVEWLEGEGHYPHITAAGAVRRVLLPFLLGEDMQEPVDEAPKNQTSPSLLQLAMQDSHRPGVRQLLPEMKKNVERAYGHSTDAFLWDLMKDISRKPPDKIPPKG